MDRRKVQKDVVQSANRGILKRRNSEREFFSVTLYALVPFLKIVICFFIKIFIEKIGVSNVWYFLLK